MPRINWKALEREEEAIEANDTLTVEEKNRAINQLYREAREQYEEELREEMRDEFGW
jgi:hypothetical protein